MLEVQRISKTFNAGTVNEKKAIQNLSLTLRDGEFATIVGSNGAGKSTLFNAIAGTFYVDQGSVTLNGADITFLPEHKRSSSIGHLFQDPLKGTAPHMTIEENLAVAYLRTARRGSLFSRVTKKDRELFREKLRELDMGLEDRMKTPVGLLSGGQRQALTLLMATMVTPELLLLDEHTAALDPVTAEKVLELTKRVVSEGKLSCLYDLYLTSYRENYALSHMAVYATTFVAYTEDPKCLTKNGEAHIRTMMANNGHKGIDVKIFTDINKYVNRLDAMNRQLDEGGAKDETEILELMKQIAL